MIESLMDSEKLQLWGGIECTVSRVGDYYRDQLVESGHAERSEDINLLCELGISAVRYPVLWERVMRSQRDATDWSCADWRWSDQRLAELKARNVEPILGLIHHGSGPQFTSLLDEGFVAGLGQHAAQVARRYPWAQWYTPVNEPLTTARFSCLYGHWYPHARSDEAFATALVLQCLATVEAMRSIRHVNSAAKLVLTEDLSKIHSTTRLRRQAEFENHRRWLSIDLLTGRVTRSHALYEYLARSPQLVSLLDRLASDPAPPDILGFNYYLTSERHLDERMKSYPAWSHGGNGRLRYADVEAVRVLRNGIDGREKLLEEAWDRYRIPMAVTEVHLCGTASEQIIWLRDCWRGTQELRSRGVDVRAVTVWSLFGSYDWNTLCTCKNGHYEPGAFDVSSGRPVPTQLASYVKQLAGGIEAPDSEPSPPGWWQSESRLIYPFRANEEIKKDWQPTVDLAAESLCTAASALAPE